jgi:hypothetical protein
VLIPIILDIIKLSSLYISLKFFHYTLSTWTVQKVDQKYLGSFEMRYWRKMEKVSWIGRVRNEEVLHRVKKERNILHTMKRRKTDWICCVLHRNCLLKHVIEGKKEGRIEVMGG